MGADTKSVGNTKRYIYLQALLYLVFYLLVWVANSIAPTNMAGPGLDAMLIILIMIYSAFFIIVNVSRSYWDRAFAHIVFLVIPVIIILIASSING